MNAESLEQLEIKIREMKEISVSHDLDLRDVLRTLEQKAVDIKKELRKQPLDVWERVQLARHAQRPTTLDYIQNLFDDFLEMHGDRSFGDDAAIVGGIATFEGIPVTVIGHQKGKNTKESIHRRFGMAQPEGYRKALRMMEQANKFNRPIITFINTAGAFPGKEAEERGQSEAIARNLREMARFSVPIICFVIGEGGSGGALALSIGNRIYMLENTFYSVISPEGASALLWKDSTKAKQAAETMKITAQDLHGFGIVDGVIPEPVGGAHKDIEEQSASLKEAIRTSLHELYGAEGRFLVEQRYNKFRQMGEFQVAKENEKGEQN